MQPYPRRAIVNTHFTSEGGYAPPNPNCQKIRNYETSLVVSGIPEYLYGTIQEKRKHDLLMLEDILKKLSVKIKLSVDDISRTRNGIENKRPLIVNLKSNHEKKLILKRRTWLKNISSTYKIDDCYKCYNPTWDRQEETIFAGDHYGAYGRQNSGHRGNYKGMKLFNIIHI